MRPEDFRADAAPREPSAQLRQGAAQLHELFVALTNEGFTETQALQIVGVVIGGQKSNG